MKATGGCYCGDVRYEIDGDPTFKGQCHCRECQYFTGGQPNMVMGIPGDALKATGDVKPFARADLENPVTREFCLNCGTSMWTKVPSMPGAFLIKVGTLDDMKTAFEGPQMAIFTCDAMPWHPTPDGFPAFDEVPR
jgi:hypothetical protein